MEEDFNSGIVEDKNNHPIIIVIGVVVLLVIGYLFFAYSDLILFENNNEDLEDNKVDVPVDNSFVQGVDFERNVNSLNSMQSKYSVPFPEVISTEEISLSSLPINLISLYVLDGSKNTIIEKTENEDNKTGFSIVYDYKKSVRDTFSLLSNGPRNQSWEMFSNTFGKGAGILEFKGESYIARVDLLGINENATKVVVSLVSL